MSTLHGESQAGTLKRQTLDKYLRLVNIDAQDSNGFTPLALAVKYGYPSVVKLLLQNGADVNKPVRDGRSPLYLAANAKQNRARVVQLLLSHKPAVDASSPEWDNDTPLMAAITQGRDPDVIRQLLGAGASLTKPNDRGDTALSLTDQMSSPQIKSAILPKDRQGGGWTELAQLLVNLVLFAMSYFDKSKLLKEILENVIRSLYNLAPMESAGGPTPPGQDIENPRTVQDFKHNISNIIGESGLEDFFPPGDTYVQQVAEKAVELKNDARNTLNSDSQMRDLARIALYQPILFLDDSQSMEVENRMERQAALAKRITNVATRLVPNNKGIHLRCLNKNDDSTANNLRETDVEQNMPKTPAGYTPIGTNLRRKILQPFVYNVIEKGVLERPFLISTITDGCPSNEEPSTFRNAILECTKRLSSKGYEKQAVRFCLSQIGNDEEAVEFLETFERDKDTEEVLYRTAGKLPPIVNDTRTYPAII
ncbi:hypothetical protein AJ79_09292 [Helicocarpus griseus UAMH5409]|uniref:Uncharacterized protein n=1 Tax=Helicocarpus griseus UAMH5409 TaxID=1447875 RepID=A0A2B7WL05_9EURO|nr:hypothetical protein AJ79_09292 [Helicocarpus griseus UAMH5409]